ncbi:MAG: hypothetical protein JW820_13290 [Spirochaetales bacterium]|nr:hypothetical protein [Spirochaetales bacterium]
MLAWARYRRIFGRVAAQEQALGLRPGALHAESRSPERVEFGSREFLSGKGPAYRLAYRARILPLLLGAGREALNGFAALNGQPALPRTLAPSELFRELEGFARAQGVDELGYATVQARQLFRGHAVLYPQAIVLLREMEADKLSRAPGLESLEMIHRSYLELGRAANRVAEFLRARGYGAQAGASLGGAVIYPVLAERAGLGAIGMHGLLITPRFGSRQRLAAVYTSIRNLPAAPGGAAASQEHDWVRDFCAACRVCASLCPAQAILSQPVEAEGGGLRHIDYRRCLPHFYALDGCSWCIKECPFNRVPYESLKRDFLDRRLRLYGEGTDP